jgi:hypothetical protein
MHRLTFSIFKSATNRKNFSKNLDPQRILFDEVADHMIRNNFQYF